MSDDGVAERIIGELAGKPPPMGRFGAFRPHAGDGAAASETATISGTRSEAISALVNLGYTQSDAARAVATAIRNAPDADTGTLIKASLKELAP